MYLEMESLFHLSCYENRQQYFANSMSVSLFAVFLKDIVIAVITILKIQSIPRRGGKKRTTATAAAVAVVQQTIG